MASVDSYAVSASVRHCRRSSPLPRGGLERVPRTRAHGKPRATRTATLIKRWGALNTNSIRQNRATKGWKKARGKERRGAGSKKRFKVKDIYRNTTKNTQ